ncbi:DUF4352 domain-containing protein [Rudaeicoccus suwonensis]|uniref:DUF4352 domain-containing protein n=1 Tax=Rudaeicoccus suwonensis TaxID=657409 RepID=A0A561DX13_9MICO|nr:DUF4352 domain-containing protein [Rudaeicoccus suwonensis]TWE07909.1 hypothetical protein BKA23_3276 [Rudaeicoccus suwonensis]
MKHYRPVTVAAAAATLVLAGCSSSGSRSAASSASPSVTPPATCSSTPAAAYSSTPIAYGAQAAIGTGGPLGVSIGKPAVTATAAGKAGFEIVQVPVRAAVITNGTFAVDQTQVELVDGSGHSCSQPSVNTLPQGFSALTIDESKPGSGSVAFLVPRGADLSRYKVLYLPAAGSKTAAAEWTATAASPSVATPTGCDGGTARVSTRGATDRSFGSSATVGDSTVSLSINAGTPTRRKFTPGTTQPNNVDALAISLKVTASGADGFVERSQFALVDGNGNVCRYSQLGSQGENLTSALIKKGRTGSYTIVFWVPKTAKVSGLKLLYTPSSATKATIVWSGGKTLAPLS